MNKEELERNLKYTKKKHENDKLNTFDTDISMLCFDTLNVLENCIEIPNGATNGDVVLATGLFEIIGNLSNDMRVCVSANGLIDLMFISFDREWWNAPYRKAE